MSNLKIRFLDIENNAQAVLAGSLYTHEVDCVFISRNYDSTYTIFFAHNPEPISSTHDDLRT